MEAPFFTVSSLNNYVRRLLEGNESIQNIRLKGEISNYRLYPSGHRYFSLKDADCRIQAVMFRKEGQNLSFNPKDGDEVVVDGDITLYTANGTYQIQVHKIEIYGIGAKLLALEKLKQQLAKEGLFDVDKKRQLPIFPQVIGVITGKNSAAEKDIIENISRRNPLVEIRLYSSSVQGEKAPSELLQALKKASIDQLDLLIIARGGGSQEDLWAFNDEKLVRALAKFPAPVISAVGHEIDTTLVDYVADKRVSTPTGAAEAAVFDRNEMLQMLDDTTERMHYDLQKMIETLYHDVFDSWRRIYQQTNVLIDNNIQKINQLTSRPVLSTPNSRFNLYEQNINNLKTSLFRVIEHLFNEKNNALQQLLARKSLLFSSYFSKQEFRIHQITIHLNSLSPRSILSRGYSLTYSADGKLLKSIQQVTLGTRVQTVLQNGKITSVVEGKDVNNGPEKNDL